MGIGYARLAEEVKNFRAVDEVHCTRLIAQTYTEARRLDATDQVIEFHAKPPTTDDVKWDTLIAGLAAHTWSLAGNVQSLSWTNDIVPLVDWWEPGNMPERWRFWNMVNSPASIRERRVIFPRQWLETV